MLHIIWYQVNANKMRLIPHLVERPNSRTPTTPNAGGDIAQQESSFLVNENAKPYYHIKRLFRVSLETKHTPTI